MSAAVLFWVRRLFGAALIWVRRLFEYLPYFLFTHVSIYGGRIPQKNILRIDELNKIL